MTSIPARRRTQTERSTETRRRLMEATLDCIAERGYRQATTMEIVRRAGVSRGAQVHHFPTKLDLVAAAVEYMYDMDLAASLKIIDRMRSTRRPLEDMMGILWEEKFHGRLWEVTVELVVAARSDAPLRDLVKPLYESYHRRGDHLALMHLRNADVDSKRLETLLNFSYCVLRGMAFQRIFTNDSAYYNELLGLLKEVSARLIQMKDEEN
jgi:AcrR family transcriptional regulator